MIATGGAERSMHQARRYGHSNKCHEIAAFHFDERLAGLVVVEEPADDTERERVHSLLSEWRQAAAENSNVVRTNPQSDTDQLEAAADHAIAACGGDAREAVKAPIVTNHFLETEKLRAVVATGCARGKCLRRLRRCRVSRVIGRIQHAYSINRNQSRRLSFNLSTSSSASIEQ
jgi:hypothetical protein